MIDFHSHVLANIDDGSDSLEESLAMLEEAYESGTDVLVLTPHYYPRQEHTLESFLEKRQKCYNELVDFCGGHRIPQLRLGCEVNLHTDISHFENIKSLCIEGTDYMLLEMPMDKWDDWIFDCIYNLTLKSVKPLMAHIDRYLGYPKDRLNALFELNPAFQVNSEAFEDFKGRKKMLELFYSGHLHVIGSDMHGIEKRKNTLPRAYTELENRFGEKFISFVEDNGEKILANKPIKRTSHFPKISKYKLLF